MLLAMALVLVVIVVIIQVAVFTLRQTGLDASEAHFQAISLLVGSGGSPSITEHPLRRKVAGTLMIIGYLGSAVLIALLFQIGKQSSLEQMGIALILLVGVGIISWFDIPDRLIRPFLENNIRRHYKRNPSHLRLQLDPHHIVCDVTITERMEFDGKEIHELPLRDMGLLIMVIVRGEETIQIPSSQEKILLGDQLIIYGEVTGIENLLQTV